MSLTDQLYGIFSFFREQHAPKIPAGAPLVIAGEDAVIVYAQTGAGIDRRVMLPWRTAGFEGALQEILHSLKPAPPPLLLFNGSNQKYRVEDIPASLSWYDQPRFVARKAEMGLPDSVARGWQKRPADPDNRKAPPSYIMTGIDKTAPLLRLSTAFSGAGVTPFACATLPLESVSLAGELASKLPRDGKDSRWVMMIGHHESGGLRQVVTKDGGLALTRITPTPYLPGEAKWDEEAAREFNTTLAYMSRLGFDAAHGLDFIVLCDAADKGFFMKKPAAARNVMALTVQEAMAAVLPGVTATPPAGNFADTLHAAWVARFGSLRVPLPYPQITPATKQGQTVH
jgi:hypothetical protein